MNEAILDIAARVFSIDKSVLTFETKREELEEWDSLAHLMLVTEFEEQFGVKIPFEQVSSIEKISDFSLLLEKN